MNEIAFDKFLEKQINEISPEEAAEILFNTCLISPELVKNRALSVKILICSNFALFDAFFSRLDKESANFPSGFVFGLSNALFEQIKSIFHDNFDEKLAEVDRLENRQRLYACEDKFEHLSDNLFQNADIDTKKFKIRKVLLERKRPNYITTGSLLNWHMDNLRDEFKIMVPLEDVDEKNGPMHLIDGSHVFSSLSHGLKDHLLTIFKLIGNYTSVLNNFDSSQVSQHLSALNKNATSLHLEKQSAYFFNTRCLHTGSENKSELRDSVTFYLEYPSRRNTILDLFTKL